jgi:FkbM family methyltransferase
MRHDISLTLTRDSGPTQITLSLDPDQMSQRFMLNDLTTGRLYESETSQFLGAVLGAGDTFIDVGAHVGYFSMLAAALVGPTGRVISFEPDVSNYAHLLEHVERNGAAQVLPVPLAVGAEPRVAEFFVNADNDGGHGLWEVGTHPFNARTREAPRTRKVFLTTLDDFIGSSGSSAAHRVKAIKIDAEGSEVAVLAGARGLIEQHAVPFIVAEINRFALTAMGTSEAALRGFMTMLGYETYLFQPGQSVLQRLTPDQTPETDYVFNVLFRHPMAPAIA